jgi:hypothetical protein
MDEATNLRKYYENRIIRLSANGRAHYGVQLGDKLSFRATNGDIIVFRVDKALFKDLPDESSYGRITSRNAELLGIDTAAPESEVQRVTGITLGCDPEAFLVDLHTGNLVGASRFFRKFGQVGHDGMMIEFRPPPSTDENVVTSHLYQLIQQARGVLNTHPEGNKIGMLGASNYAGLAAGFHLHYGLPSAFLGYGNNKRNLARIMTLAFDYYIGVPAIIPEGCEDYRRRTQTHVEYGKPGNYRLDGRTFEYRLPGGVLLQHPVLTRGILALGATVVEDLVSRLNTRTDGFLSLGLITRHEDLKELYPRLPDIHGLFNIICSIDIKPAREHFIGIVDDVRQMVGYDQRAASIEPFFQCLIDGTKFSKNIEHNWGGFPNAQQQGQMVSH